MVELQQSVLTEMDQRGRSMVVDELLALVERYHPSDGPGVPLDVVESYLAEMESRGFADASGLDDILQDRLTDADGWSGRRAIYDLGDGRVSSMPPEWHEKLDGVDDLRTYVEVMNEDLAEGDGSGGRGAAGTGVSKQLLVTAATILGDYDRAGVRQELESLRDDDILVEDADQHPQARIYLAR